MMAMRNFCYAQGIECPYATAGGHCLDDIYEDFGVCEMLGDELPPKELSAADGRAWITNKYHGGTLWATN